MNDKNIYKINKYNDKFNKEKSSETKLIYARKYLQYLTLLNNNIKNNTTSQTGGNLEEINKIIKESSEQLEKINEYIELLKPTFDLVNNLDEIIKILCLEYEGYKLSEDLIDYYSETANQSKELLK